MAGDELTQDAHRSYSAYSTSGDNMTPENNAVLAFAQSIGFDVYSFIQHNGWTVWGGRYDAYYDTAQGQADMAGSIAFTDYSDIGSIWPDNVWQGINKWIGVSTWDQMNDYLHNGANPGTQCAGLVNVFFGYIYKTDLYKDSSWKAYYDAYSYGTRNNLSGVTFNFNGVGSVESGILGIEHFKGTNGYYAKTCNNYTMTHDAFVAMLDQMAPGAVIRFANNRAGESNDALDHFAYQHSAIYIGKANGLHWMFHNNMNGKSARISPIEFFADSFIQGSGDTLKTRIYIGHAGGMLNVPQEQSFSVGVAQGTTETLNYVVTPSQPLTLNMEASTSISSYRWQVSKNGGSTWKNVNTANYPSALTPSLTFTPTAAFNGYQYRCLVTYKSGTKKYSARVQLVTDTTAKITSQPSNTTVSSGQKVTFSVGTEGTVSDYIWQVSKDNGSTWTNIKYATFPSAVTANLSFTTKTAYSGYKYRCVITFASGTTLVTTAAKLTVTSGKITAQPEAAVVKAGNSASFTVATNKTSGSYHWQVSKDGGSTWKNVNSTSYPSALTVSLTFTTTTSLDGYLYRCKVTFPDGAVMYSDAAALTVNGVASPPSAASAAVGNTVSFRVAATGSVRKYHWQVSKDGGTTWKSLNTDTYPSAATNQLTFTATAAMNGYRYRCIVYFNGTSAIYTSAAVLTIQ